MWQFVVQEDWVSHCSQSYVTVCSTRKLSLWSQSYMTFCSTGKLSHWSQSYMTVCSTGKLSHWSQSHMTVCSTGKLSHWSQSMWQWLLETRLSHSQTPKSVMQQYQLWQKHLGMIQWFFLNFIFNLHKISSKLTC
jgi:hypothetical protein